MDGERARRRRKELKISGETIAQKLRTTKATVSRWESGVSEPDDKTKIALAKLLNTTVSYLIGETNNPTPYEARGGNKFSDVNGSEREGKGSIRACASQYVENVKVIKRIRFAYGGICF